MFRENHERYNKGIRDRYTTLREIECSQIEKHLYFQLYDML